MSMFEVKYDTLTDVGRTIACTADCIEAIQIANDAEEAGLWNVRIEEVSE